MRVKVSPNLTNQGIKKLNEAFKGIRFTISSVLLNTEIAYFLIILGMFVIGNTTFVNSRPFLARAD